MKNTQVFTKLKQMDTIYREEKTMTIYKNRYQARKVAEHGDVVVKVEGGYIIMSAGDYEVWKRQK